MGTPVNTPSSSRNGTPQVSLASKSSTVPNVTPRRSNQLPDKSRSVPWKSFSASHMTPSRQVAITGTAGSRDENGTQANEDCSLPILKEISSKLNFVAEQMVRIESRLEAVEKKSSTSSSSDARCRMKRAISRALRVS